MLPAYFAIIGDIIGASGGIGYLILTIQGKVKPNKVTFLLWSLAPLIVFFAQITQGIGIQAFLAFTIGFFPLLIFIASFFNKKSQWKITTFDLICGALSIIGLILWITTKVGNIAITFSIIADGLAALPTIIKTYKYPETEKGWTYLTSAIAAIFTLLTITTWDYAYYAFAIYIVIVDFTIFILAQFKFGKIAS